MPRVLKAGSDLQQGKLGFGAQNLLREEEAKDWHARLDSLKKFTESLAPYNTVGKLKNLRVTQEDLDGQKKNLDILAAVERLLELVMELGSTASYLAGRDGVARRAPWVKQAELPARHCRKTQPRTAQPSTPPNTGKRSTSSEGLHHRHHRQPQQGAAGRGREKTRNNALRRDDRLLARAYWPGVSLMPTSQLTAFEESLNG